MKRRFLAITLLAACGPMTTDAEDAAAPDAAFSEKTLTTRTDLYVECGFRCDRQFPLRCPSMDSYDELDVCWDDCRDWANYLVSAESVAARYNLLVCERVRDQAYECRADGRPNYVWGGDECDWERWAVEDYDYPDGNINYKTRALTSCETHAMQSYRLGCAETATSAYLDGRFQHCEDFVHYSVPYTCLYLLDSLQNCATADAWGNGRRYICAGGWPWLTSDACGYQRQRFNACLGAQP
jgi:hypothetical protein